MVEDKRLRSINYVTSFQSTFGDLISNYKDKGYKISDLSTKKSLFEPSPLLLDNNKIFNNSDIGHLNKIYQKDLSYLHKIGGMMQEKFIIENNFSSPPSHMIKDNILKSNYQNEYIGHNKTITELVDEIREKEKYLNDTRRFINSNEYKHIYDLQHLNNNDKKIIDSYQSKKSILNNSNLFSEEKESRRYRRNRIPKPNQIYKTFVYSKKLKKFHALEDKSDSSIIQETENDKDKFKKYKSNISTKESQNSLNILSSFDSSLYSNRITTRDNRQEIIEEVENSIKSRINPDLELILDKIQKKEFNKDTLIKYFVKQGKDKDLLEENFNK